MDDDSRPTPLLICQACGAHHDAGLHLCSKCNAPLTPFASSDWVLGIQTRGFALQKATTEPKKLIVVVGMWLWLGPMLMIGAGMLLFGSTGLYHSIGAGDSSILRPAMIVCGIGLGITWVAGVILYRTTATYARDRQARRHESADESSDAEDEDRGETLTCFACGEVLPAAKEQCANCGWSFKEADPNAGSTA